MTWNYRVVKELVDSGNMLNENKHEEFSIREVYYEDVNGAETIEFVSTMAAVLEFDSRQELIDTLKEMLATATNQEVVDFDTLFKGHDLCKVE